MFGSERSHSLLGDLRKKKKKEEEEEEEEKEAKAQGQGSTGLCGTW